MDKRKLVGRNVKRSRHDRGLTRDQLAEPSGFSRESISDLKLSRRNLTIVSIYELATGLGVGQIERVRPAKK